MSGSVIIGNLLISDVIMSNSETSGALIVAGGVGIDGNINIGGECTINGTTIYVGAQADQSKSDQTPTTGFSITIANNSTTLLLTPASVLDTGTIIMPAAPIDGQSARVLSSQTVTDLTVSANEGQNIIGAPNVITSSTPFTMIYDLNSTTWYRAG